MRRVDHDGKYYRVQGYHLAEPSPQRTPVLYQAGSSGRGLAFAARHAECVFVSSQTKEGLRKLVSELRAAVAREGRDPRDIKFFMGITAVVGRTEREARDKHAEYLRYASPEAGLAHYASSTGIDFSTYAPDEPIRYVKNNAIESAVRSLTVARTDRTVRDLLADMALAGAIRRWWAAPRRWPTSWNPGSRKPASTASTWRARSRRNAMRTSSTW